ncbi:MAG: MFS transporter [Acidobacteria bacterium]|nr:MFS transporter [Acidobacteriota bacterium]
MSNPPVALHTLSRRRRIGILLICSMSLLIVSLDVTILNVALPSIGHDLHTTVSGLQWTVDAYTLVLASLLMLSGSTGDRLGRRKVFLTGLGLFTVGSLLCSVAPSLGLLVVFRMMQAVGGSMLNPVAMSIVTNTFTDPRERAQALGIWAAVVGVSMAFGPLVGGALVDSVGWRSVFWINIPIGIAAIVLTTIFVPESKAPRPRRLDAVGQALVIVILTTLTYAIIEAPNKGWSSPLITTCWIASVVSIVALLRWEKRRDEPLLELRFFHSIPFAGAAVLALAAFGAQGGFLFLNTLYLQEVRGLSPIHAGLALLPMAVMALVLPPLSGRMVGTRGSRLPLLISGLGTLAGFLLLSRLSATSSMWYVEFSYAVFGVGFGFVNAPITTAAVAGMPRAQAGVASAVASTSRQVGATLGVAVVGALAVSAAHRGPVRASDLVSGWWVLVGAGVVILVVGQLVTSARARLSAEITARELNPEYLEGLAT